MSRLSFLLRHVFDTTLVQWLERLPQGQLEYRNFCHKLSPFHLIPYFVHRSPILLSHPDDRGGGHGFRVRHCADRGRRNTRRAPKKHGGSLLEVAGEFCNVVSACINV